MFLTKILGIMEQRERTDAGITVEQRERTDAGIRTVFSLKL